MAGICGHTLHHLSLLGANFVPVGGSRLNDYLLWHAGRLKSMMYREVTPARHHLPPKSREFHVNPRRLGDRFEIYGIE